jgi:hypothetical protein
MFTTNRLTLTVGWSQSGSDSVSGTTNQLVMVEMTHDTVDIKALLCNYLACRIATLTRIFTICTKRFDPSAARIRALQSRRALPLLLRVKSTSRASDEFRLGYKIYIIWTKHILKTGYRLQKSILKGPLLLVATDIHPTS